MGALRQSEVRTEHLLVDLLTTQGWNTARPPKGDLLTQQEYRDHAHLLAIFKGKSKQGRSGDARPEAILVDRATMQPLIVVEAKARTEDIGVAVKEITEYYGTWSVQAGFSPLAVAIAGTSEDDFKLRVFKWTGKKWAPVTYDGNPIGWIPNRADTDSLRAAGPLCELRPSIPPPEVLAERADEINRLLREAKIKDEYRPGIVGAVMLALWQSKGHIRKEPENILADINEACRKAFWKAKKPDLSKSLYVDEANDTLAIKARRIVAILERLNVSVLTAEHDYLGQLYETFFRYTGGNTIGQFFTPRHMTSLMADICEITPKDVVFDPACGTGGFLVAVMNRIQKVGKLSRVQMVDVVKKNLIGMESEPATAALCVANMILRGDGSTGVTRGDCFTADNYPIGTVDVVLMNPPFPHKKTDTPSEMFIDRGLEALKHRGQLAVIIPQSLLVKGDKSEWREKLLKKNTLDGVIVLPDDLFLPFASSFTAILLMRKGVAHPDAHEVFFARIENDGYKIKKEIRVAAPGEQLTVALDAYRKKKSIPRFCGWRALDRQQGWHPALYIPTEPLTRIEIDEATWALTRQRAAFVVGHARELCLIRADMKSGTIKPQHYHAMKRKPHPEPPAKNATSIGDLFDIEYGQRELHSKENLAPGRSLVVSSSGTDNGWYGFFDFPKLIEPPFATVPSTGSIGEAFVQEWPCGVTDDCLILTPKKGVPPELLYVAAATVRNETWRFSYGTKITPSRIAWFPMLSGADVVADVRAHADSAARVEKVALNEAADLLEDEDDARIAVRRMAEVRRGNNQIISGTELERQLAEMDA